MPTIMNEIISGRGKEQKSASERVITNDVAG